MTDKKSKKQDVINKYNEIQINENFVPIDEKDVLRAIDIPVEEKQIEIIEKVSTRKGFKKGKSNKKKETDKKVKKSKIKKTFNQIKNNWTENFKVPGSEKLDPKGYILLITEKPQAAAKIADALSERKVIKNELGGVSYYDIERGGKEIKIVCAVGHLFTLAQVKPRNPWPTFDIKWAPNFLVRKNDFSKKYYDVISKLCKKASKIIVATDYDIEGEVIGMNIVRYICNQKDAERMKFSTLTAEEIKEAYEKRSKTLDWKQGIAGETRHYLDWIYGINLSRALMDAVKTAGSFRLLSIGRVQGPTLNIIVKKEHEISNFKSQKYWDILLDVSDNKNIIQVKHVKDVIKENELDKFNKLKDKEGIAKTEKTQKKINPPVPFDLTNLQTEIYKLHKIVPSKTLEIAQRLYLSGLISYPRTNSQKIPKEIGYDKIIDRLKIRFDFVKFAKNKFPIEGKKSDPAHPSIYPTGEFHKIEGDDEKVYNLIVKRFISCFCEDAIINNKNISVIVDNLKFVTKGMSIVERGWMNVYPSDLKEKEIPDMNGVIIVKNIKIEEKYTQPPHRYTPASIISELEKKNLGTKATRAAIIETLYDRSYIKEKSIEATTLGIYLIDTLEKNCPIIIDEKLTRIIENQMDKIRESKNPLENEKKILSENEKIIYKIGEEFNKHKIDIGKSLISATTQLWEDEKKQAEIGNCNICKKGRLVIKYNRSSNRSFIACNAYPDCKTTYSLPPNSLIKKTDKTCVECGFPLLISLKKGKKPWIFCFNPTCITRKNKD
ncbi:MAG TPA: DNA topoisomerase I [Candidatus Paceibacterota bacterium]|nr:DNA topoisomerase I [Candidatus Paceibacterota bacterium]